MKRIILKWEILQFRKYQGKFINKYLEKLLQLAPKQ